VRVLVTDAANRVALAVVRALGRAGAEVQVVEQERLARSTPAAFRSRHVSRADAVPGLEDEEAFVGALSGMADGVDVLLPVSTNVLFVCARHRDRFRCRLPIPDLAALRRANDKALVLEAARRAGVPAPETWPAGRAARFPAVVKLRDDEGTELEPGVRYAVVRNEAELAEAWERLHRIRPRPLVQEYVAGEGYGVGVLAEEGRILALASHRRVREYPAGGGPSAACVSVRDARLEALSAALIRELGWTGVAMVEFRKDDDFRLMEVNPRFWGALPLATAAGVNFPDLLCRRAMGLPAPAAECRPGVKLRFLGMELAGAWQSARAGRWGYGAGVLGDLLDARVRDGILEWDDLDASLAWYAARLPS
jgi:predicted ATP-grasp superfamily ATP-dependent carboligase